MSFMEYDDADYIFAVPRRSKRVTGGPGDDPEGIFTGDSAEEAAKEQHEEAAAFDKAAGLENASQQFDDWDWADTEGGTHQPSAADIASAHLGFMWGGEDVTVWTAHADASLDWRPPEKLTAGVTAYVPWSVTLGALATAGVVSIGDKRGTVALGLVGAFALWKLIQDALFWQAPRKDLSTGFKVLRFVDTHTEDAAGWPLAIGLVFGGIALRWAELGTAAPLTMIGIGGLIAVSHAYRDFELFAGFKNFTFKELLFD